MRLWIGLAFAACAAFTTGAPASAGGFCSSSLDPMATSEGYGASSCGSRLRRYHIDDFAGERVRGYVRHVSEDDPMVWSDDQWRSDLMSYSDVSDDRYDRRFRHVQGPMRVVRHVVKIMVAPPIEAAIRTLIPGRGFNTINMRGLEDRPHSSARAIGRSCGGMLLLRWTGYRAKAECISSPPAKRRSPSSARAFPGRG